MGVGCGRVIVLCDSLYIGIWYVFVTYSNVVFMELIGLLWEWSVGGLLYCVTVYISVFGVCLLCTAMLCLWN